jgi:hydrogenase 3 maturation protease
MKNLVLTVGNGMMGDDAAGPLLAQMLRRDPLDHWDVLDGGSVPENLLHQIREISPDLVLVVDSADMDLEPGEIRRIQPEKIHDPFFITTHSLPLTYLMQSLGEFVQNVEMIGIQPDVVAFGYPLSASVEQAVAVVYESLKQDCIHFDNLE